MQSLNLDMRVCLIKVDGGSTIVTYVNVYQLVIFFLNLSWTLISCTIILVPFIKNLVSKDGTFDVTNENSSMYIGGGT